MEKPQPHLRELVTRAPESAAPDVSAKASVTIEEEQSFGFDVCQESGRMEGFAYHHLVKVDYYPNSEPKAADKIVVTMWAHRGEICGYGLKPLVQALARGRGFSIEVRPEKYAVLAPAKTMYVYAANFEERKEAREKETDAEAEPGPDLPGARDVDPAAFNAERKGAKKTGV